MLRTPRRLLPAAVTALAVLAGPAAVTALAVLAGPAAAVAASGRLVEVRAVSTTRDVIRPSVTGTAQAYTDDAGVAHALAGPTALGALVTAANAQGRTVTGTYFPSFSDLLVTRIAGVHPASATGFWSFFLNGAPAQTGAGSTPVKRGRGHLHPRERHDGHARPRPRRSQGRQAGDHVPRRDDRRQGARPDQGRLRRRRPADVQDERQGPRRRPGDEDEDHDRLRDAQGRRALPDAPLVPGPVAPVGCGPAGLSRSPPSHSSRARRRAANAVSSRLRPRRRR